MPLYRYYESFTYVTHVLNLDIERVINVLMNVSRTFVRYKSEINHIKQSNLVLFFGSKYSV